MFTIVIPHITFQLCRYNLLKRESNFQKGKGRNSFYHEDVEEGPDERKKIGYVHTETCITKYIGVCAFARSGLYHLPKAVCIICLMRFVSFARSGLYHLPEAVCIICPKALYLLPKGIVLFARSKPFRLPAVMNNIFQVDLSNTRPAITLCTGSFN